jgi:aspartyl aminopeptidase
LNGAGSPVLKEAVERISYALGASQADPEIYANTISKSFCLSIDQAHAVHPNYSAKHESQHAPTLNSGLVIKTNCNQRYTTNSLTGFLLRELARKCDVPVQEFAGM